MSSTPPHCKGSPLHPEAPLRSSGPPEALNNPPPPGPPDKSQAADEGSR